MAQVNNKVNSLNKISTEEKEAIKNEIQKELYRDLYNSEKSSQSK